MPYFHHSHLKQSLDVIGPEDITGELWMGEAQVFVEHTPCNQCGTQRETNIPRQSFRSAKAEASGNKWKTK